MAFGLVGEVTGGSTHALPFGEKWQARVQLTPVLLRYWTQLSGLILPNRVCSAGVDGDPDTLVGPRLSAQARVRVLRSALAEAERGAAALPVEP